MLPKISICIIAFCVCFSLFLVYRDSYVPGADLDSAIESNTASHSEALEIGLSPEILNQELFDESDLSTTVDPETSVLNFERLSKRYFELLVEPENGLKSFSPDEYSELCRLLSSMQSSGADPRDVLAAYSALAEETAVDSNRGSLAISAMGAILSDIFSQDPSVGEDTYQLLLDPREDEAIRVMSASALVMGSGHADYQDNLFSGFEYDMLEVGLTTDSSLLQATLFGNIARSRNYEVIDQMVDYAFSAPLSVAGLKKLETVLATVYQSEKWWIDKGEVGEDYGEIRDSRKATTQRLYEKLRGEIVHEQMLYEVASTFGRLGRLSLVVKMKDEILPNYSIATRERFRKTFDRGGFGRD